MARFHGRSNRGLSTVSSKPHRTKTDLLTVFGLMHTVRCGFDGIPAVRFGAVLRNRKSYAMRLGAVFGCCKSYGAVRCCDISYGAVR